jgi:monoamine oxidase
MAKVSRRQVLGGAVSGSILIGTGTRASAQEPAASGPVTADVCVVGAGFAGLSAAFRLRRAGAEVVVLEARDRVGGRSFTLAMEGGGWVDMGAQWVGPPQDRFLALIKEMGCETYPSPYDGKWIQRGILDSNAYDRVSREGPDGYPGGRLVKAGFDQLDRLAARLDPEQPWAYPDAERLDATTLAEWLRQNIPHPNARSFVAQEVSSAACATPEEISILHTLFLIKSCRGIDLMFGDEGAAQQDCVIGGTQRVARRLADKMAGAIRYETPVRKIEWNERGATVHADGLSVAARHVVVATPPYLAGAIAYQPELPASRAQVTRRWPQGTVIKVQIIYREPFWRRERLNGESFDYVSVLGETVDSSLPSRFSRAGILTGFIYSEQARMVSRLPADERKKLVLGEVAKRFGRRSLEPVRYLESSWSTQPWTGGCFTGYLTPGATVAFRSAVRDPVGPLHWAGTETATAWPSFIEGAIRSGERAASAIRKAG